MTRTKLLRISVAAFLLFSVFQLFTYNHLEFRTEALYDTFLHGSYALFSILVGLICIFLPKNNDGQAGRMLGIIALPVIALVWITSAYSIPKQTKIKWDNKVLFVSKENKDKKVIEQIYFTGMTGNDVYDTVVTVPLLKNIRWTRRFDVQATNLKEWIVVVQK